jgi:hypothetical protein
LRVLIRSVYGTIVFVAPNMAVFAVFLFHPFARTALNGLCTVCFAVMSIDAVSASL